MPCYENPWRRSTKRIKDYHCFNPCCPPYSVLRLHSCAQWGADSTGCSKWLMKMVGGHVCLCRLQLYHTVLNMTLGSSKGLVSLWMHGGRHGYWSEWQIKAGKWVGGLDAGGVYDVSAGVCLLKNEILLPDQKQNDIGSQLDASFACVETYDIWPHLY